MIKFFFLTFFTLTFALYQSTDAFAYREYVELVSSKNLGNKKSHNLDLAKYSLETDSGREEILIEIQNLLEIAKLEKEEKISKKDAENFKISNDIKKGLKFAQKIITRIADSNTEEKEKRELNWKLFSILEAINNNFRDNIITHLTATDLIKYPFKTMTFKAGHNPIEIIQEHGKNSSFWHDPKNISKLNLINGFNRYVLPNYSDTIFNYSKAKTGTGSHAGFRVTDDLGNEFKIRIGPETNVAPFSSRIIWALGYNTSIIDNLKILKVKYNRKLLSEFNSRKEVELKITLRGKDIYRKTNQDYLDPFKDISRAILKDGKIIDGKELKKHLLINHEPKAEETESNYNSLFEQQINYLEFFNVSIEKIEPKNYSIGPWDWGLQEHINTPELRGYALLAAWLGQYDARTENTRLTLIETDNGIEMVHAITDVGSGLGGASWLLNFKRHSLKRFEDRFLEIDSSINGPDHIESYKFRTLYQNPTFQSMNQNDAQWMIEKIMQLTEKQIIDALNVAGFSEIEVKGLTKKLVKRRNHAYKVIYRQ